MTSAVTNKNTSTDNDILEAMKVIMDGLGDFLGSGCEIVLHSLDNLEESVVKIVHGFHSGREVGAPITDLALAMLSRIEKSNGNKNHMVYFNKNKNGVLIKSTTIPIIGEGKRIIGLICFNFFTDAPISSLLNGMVPADSNGVGTTEFFAESTDALIAEMLEKTKVRVYKDSSISTSNKNKEIIAILYEKGIFNLKDAVVKVAENLNISKNTVYLHLRSANNFGASHENDKPL
jgi:predicted transcriptional regulator YheO